MQRELYAAIEQRVLRERLIREEFGPPIHWWDYVLGVGFFVAFAALGLCSTMPVR